MRLRILVSDERREIRNDAVDGAVGVAKAPRGLDARMRPDPSAVHGDGDKRLSRAVAWRDAGRRYRPDAADGDLVLLAGCDTVGPTCLKPLNVHAVGEPHDHRPSVVQCVAQPALPVGVPRMRVPRLSRADVQGAGALRGRERRVPQSHHVVRWRRSLLQESDVGVHLQQLTPRLAARVAMFQLTTVTANASSGDSVRNPTTCLLWSTPCRKSQTATGSAGQTSRRKRRNGLTASSPRECC